MKQTLRKTLRRTPLLLILAYAVPGQGSPAARVGDKHMCPMVTGFTPHVGGSIVNGEPTVLICGKPAARTGDKASCTGSTATVIGASSNVIIGGKPAARMGDATAHGGKVIGGCSSVQIN